MGHYKIEVKRDKNKYNIAIAVCIIVLICIIAYLVIDYNKKVETSSKLNIDSQEEKLLENIISVADLTAVENITSIEELQKLNEKELEEKTSDEDKKEKDKQNTNTPPYYIKVNYGAQVVTVYKKDEDGKYTKPVKAMVCSTGTHTPTGGVYKIPAKIGWCGLIGDVYGQYTTQIVGDILFHSVPYLKKGDKSSIEYWEYDKLGTKASLGCVRLTCADAQWIYNNCRVGTQVEFYSSSNPGPLGKPSARKISSAPENIRGWDPTDPASNNPWRDYLKNNNNNDENNNKNETSNEVKNEITNELNNETTNNTINNDIIDNSIFENKIENEINGSDITNEIDNSLVENNISDIVKDNELDNDTTTEEITDKVVNIINDNTESKGD